MTLALFALAGLALSQAPVEPRPWPGGAVGKFHLLGAGAIGTCVRWNTPIAGSGPCGELAIAIDIPFSPQWRFGAELGVGFLRTTTVRDAEVLRSSGGPASGSLRVMLQLDLLPTFFVRLGPQGRVTMFEGRAIGGLHGVVEVGTRIARLLELGVRLSVGADGVMATAAPRWAPALGLGATLVTRVLIF